MCYRFQLPVVAVELLAVSGIPGKMVLMALQVAAAPLTGLQALAQIK